MPAASPPTLTSRLADALPLNFRFHVHHLSSPPTLCPAIYSVPPEEHPEKTFRESHFLSVTIDSTDHQLQVFALEVLIYTTESLTTLFVSKADSTGYIHSLSLPKGTPSPLKSISTTFIAFLIETRRRPDRKLVLSLFARAQDQYLFPGSIENPHKHVLDDRGLVKWWCQVVDPILRKHPSNNEEQEPETNLAHAFDDSYTARGFLRVPGCDSHEITSFFPKGFHGSQLPRKWLPADPLRDLGRSPNLPERCLIPRFPDDPKARFVEELDDELPNPLSHNRHSPSKVKQPGRWKSVRSLEEFWEMMAFRQECSSGRLVGFLWGVFTPMGKFTGPDEIKRFNGSLNAPLAERNGSGLATPIQSQEQNRTRVSSQSPLNSILVPETPITRSPSSPTPTPKAPAASSGTPSPGVRNKSKHPPTGPITSHEPRTIKAQPAKTRHYFWPSLTRGEVVLREKDYQRVNNLLLHLDYANEGIAAKSTKRWIDDVAVVGRVERWGYTVDGLKQVNTVTKDVRSDVATLDTGLVRKKRRNCDDIDAAAESASMHREEPEVNVLSVGLIRKKAKITGKSDNGS
ncbi:hypothetical protein MMC07_005630 [Pseudocyphellaria aurata]|nr:hypothetical protein [Pseudocyphellaria aurata]